MIEIPVGFAYLLVALAAYGVLVSAIMFAVAVANFFQRTTMRKEVGNLEQEIALLRNQLKREQLYVGPKPVTHHVGTGLKYGRTDDNDEYFLPMSVP